MSDEEKPAAAGALDVGEYCRQVEDHLTRVNGGHLVRIVGPGFDLVRQWADAGIPLSVVFRGIAVRAERHRAGRARRPLRIEFCETDVRVTYDRWRRAVGVASAEPGGEGTSIDAAEPRRRSLTRHLDRAIDRMGAIGGRLDLPEALRDATSRLLQDLVALRDTARKARGVAREDAFARLASLDADLVAVARASAAPALLESLRLEAEQDLAPYRDRLAGDAWQRSIDVTVSRLLRDHFGLPTLDL